MGTLLDSLGGAGCRLFLSERDSDVSIRVEWEGQGWRFPCHKIILSAMSDVMRTMLTVDMREKNERTIIFRETDPQVAKQLLRYIYTGFTEFGEWWETLALISLAHQYTVPALVRIGEGHLLQNLNLNNCVNLHEAAVTFNLSELKGATSALLMGAAFVLCGREDFTHVCSQTLHWLLRSASLNVESEELILEALRRWAVNDCAKNCRPLTKSNICQAMQPFLVHIRWRKIPERHRRLFAVDSVAAARRHFHTSNLLQQHFHLIKFVVELGAFYERHAVAPCLRFSIDTHAFLVGFRLVGLFDRDTREIVPFTGPSSLTLSRDDRRVLIQLNLNSLAWTRGSSGVKEGIWRELIAFLPTPLRIDPFAEYSFILRVKASVKWPKTRMESGQMSTCLGSMQLRTRDVCFGMTQLFLLPAPPPPGQRLANIED